MDFLRLIQFNRNKEASSHPQVHMTWMQSSVGRTVSRTGTILRKQIWIWPIIAVALLSTIGLSVRFAIESTMKENLRSQLRTLLVTERAMLEKWLEGQSSNAEGVANDIQVRRAISRLLDFDSVIQSSGGESDRQGIQSEVGKILAPMTASRHFVGFFVADRSKRIVASSHESLLGRSDVRSYDNFLSRTLDGASVVSPPDGYRDYRGAMVLGAWTWMPEYRIGLATEIDRVEAYRPLTILRRTFAALYMDRPIKNVPLVLQGNHSA